MHTFLPGTRFSLKVLFIMLRKTYIEIDLNAIRNNLNRIRDMAGPGVKILLPVKADAYGHGIEQVSCYVESEGLADMLGVASIDEGISLRRAGITMPILLLQLILPEKEQIEAVLDNDLTLTIADAHTAEAVSGPASARGTTVPVHLKVDTGMGRIGCAPEQVMTICRRVLCLDNVKLDGIYSHFAVADEDLGFTGNQSAVFNNILNTLEAEGIIIPFRHISNSAGLLNCNDSGLNMIRPGIISYGYSPYGGGRTCDGFIPAMTLKSILIFMKRVKKGTPLSYGLTYRTESDSTIATVPVGYGDGYSRFISNRGSVLIQGREYPVVGRVSMDQILVNLGDDSFPVGEEVVLFGRETITADTVAEWIGTIPYEITCGISKRVPRIYLK